MNGPQRGRTSCSRLVRQLPGGNRLLLQRLELCDRCLKDVVGRFNALRHRVRSCQGSRRSTPVLALVASRAARYAPLRLATTALRLYCVALGLAATVAAVTAGVAGCGTQCDRQPNEPPIAYRGGFTNRAAGTYLSAGNHGPFLDFPPGRTYRFYHGLGGEPEGHHTDLAFSEHPLDGGGGFVEAAGNQVTYEAANSEYVDVRNDTCSEVWIRVELNDPILSSEPDAALPGSTADGGK